MFWVNLLPLIVQWKKEWIFLMFDQEKQEQTTDSFTRHLLIQTWIPLNMNRRRCDFENVCACLPVDRPRGQGHCSACSCTRSGRSETSDSAWRPWAGWSGSYQTHPAPAAYGGRSSSYLRNTSRADITPFSHYKTVCTFCFGEVFYIFWKDEWLVCLYWSDKHQRWWFC